MKILIADDEAIYRDLFVAIMEKFPEHQVTPVDSGQAAWDMLNDRGRHFDALFLDVRMPGMSGMDLLRLLYESPFHRSLQTVMCTGLNDRQTIIQAVQFGARHYLIKPCTTESVMAKIKLLAPAVPVDLGRRQKVSPGHLLDHAQPATMPHSA
jgi:CheY-like chemotaxis protein